MKKDQADRYGGLPDLFLSLVRSLYQMGLLYMLWQYHKRLN